ncbi:MAG: NAD-dependent epimerase [Proteobacteria bacterium]|nr:NAD-dependent epimerase [Pseudomonadota bacterium]
MRKILVTGTAGFIGFSLARRLLDRGDTVVGLDNINDYYDVMLKYGRLAETGIAREQITYGQSVQSSSYPRYKFVMMNVEDREKLFDLFKSEQFDMVCHLAAQAGVRYSLVNPYAYISSNIVGFMNILEACRQYSNKHLVYASSSSVYGLNEEMPFSTHHNVDHPISLYGATKKSNELMAHSYSYLYNIPSTGLRFFTVYGPWGRPDMALFQFTKAILEGNALDVYNDGKMQRDFTYIDDIIEGVLRVMDKPPAVNKDWSGKCYNIGNSKPVSLLDFIEAIEETLGKKAKMNLLPMQPGDVPATWADVNDLIEVFDYKPHTPFKEGIKKFIAWYKTFYKD